MLEAKTEHPMYGLWLTDTIPMLYHASTLGGGFRRSTTYAKKGNGKTWFDIMSQVREEGKYGGKSPDTRGPRTNNPHHEK